MATEYRSMLQDLDLADLINAIIAHHPGKQLREQTLFRLIRVAQETYPDLLGNLQFSSTNGQLYEPHVDEALAELRIWKMIGHPDPNPVDQPISLDTRTKTNCGAAAIASIGGSPVFSSQDLAGLVGHIASLEKPSRLSDNI